MHNNIATYIMMCVCMCVFVYKNNTEKDFLNSVFLISK